MTTIAWDPEVLAREEQLGAALAGLQDSGLLGEYMALSQSLPSPARVTADRTLLAQRLHADGGALEQFARLAGCRPGPGLRDLTGGVDQ